MDESEYTITKVPRDESARRELLATRPPVWEYLLFGGALEQGLQRTEPKWRDYHLGFSSRIGPRVAKEDLADELGERLSRGSAIAYRLEKLFDRKAQDLAFGEPGMPGDPDLVEHIANRTIDMYEALLDWAIELRSLRVPEETAELIELAVLFVEQPIGETRFFIREYVNRLEDAVESLKRGNQRVNLSLGLTFTIRPEVTQDFQKALFRILG